MQRSLQRALIKAHEAVQDYYMLIRRDTIPMSSVDLFNFKSDNDIAKFQLTTDGVLGGNTTANLDMKKYDGFTSACFHGSVDFTADSAQHRGGFASFRTLPDERVRQLDQFRGIEMRVKTDGRPYVVNLKSASFPADHLWQMKIVTPPLKWTTVCIPFKDLVLTKRGTISAIQTPFAASDFAGFGILLADGLNGPFRFEVQWIKAVRELNPSQLESVPEELEDKNKEEFVKLLREGLSPEELKKMDARDSARRAMSSSEARLD